MPRIARAGEELVHLERAVRVEIQRLEIELDVAALRIVRVDVDDRQHDVVAGGLAVAEDLVVRRLVKEQRDVLLQGRILAADAVHERDHLRQVVVRAPPVLDLVFLGIEVLLAPRLARGVDEALEGRAVNAVIRAERRGEHEADSGRRAAAVLQIFGEDVGRVRPGIGTEKVAHRRLSNFVEILGQFEFRIAPGGLPGKGADWLEAFKGQIPPLLASANQLNFRFVSGQRPQPNNKGHTPTTMEWARKLSKNDIGIVTGKAPYCEKVPDPDEGFTLADGKDKERARAIAKVIRARLAKSQKERPFGYLVRDIPAEDAKNLTQLAGHLQESWFITKFRKIFARDEMNDEQIIVHLVTRKNLAEFGDEPTLLQMASELRQVLGVLGGDVAHEVAEGPFLLRFGEAGANDLGDGPGTLLVLGICQSEAFI